MDIYNARKNRDGEIFCAGAGKILDQYIYYIYNILIIF